MVGRTSEREGGWVGFQVIGRSRRKGESKRGLLLGQLRAPPSQEPGLPTSNSPPAHPNPDQKKKKDEPAPPHSSKALSATRQRRFFLHSPRLGLEQRLEVVLPPLPALLAVTRGDTWAGRGERARRGEVSGAPPPKGCRFFRRRRRRRRRAKQKKKGGGGGGRRRAGARKIGSSPVLPEAMTPHDCGPCCSTISFRRTSSLAVHWATVRFPPTKSRPVAPARAGTPPPAPPLR